MGFTSNSPAESELANVHGQWQLETEFQHSVSTSIGAASKLAKKAEDSPLARVAYTLAEFAALFGKERTWAYRQVYGQHVKAIKKGGGRLMIPASEVGRILATAENYSGSPRPKPSKRPATAELWGHFIAATRAKARRNGKPGRSAALARVASNRKK